ncbi:MAG: UDP-3-O-(3-hydroxymyristoyl)glucosamine N-acyltransferase, partial [Endomicrobiia bacterium]
QIIEGELFGDENIIIKNVNDVEKAGPGDITFVKDEKYFDIAKKTKASCVIVPKKIDGLSIPYIIVEDPYLAFIKILNILYLEKRSFYKGIHPTAIIGKNVKVSEEVSLGPYCVIEDNVVIKKNTILGCFVYVGKNVEIGENVLIYSNVTIREDTKIGNNVIIHSGTVIGSDGFGYLQKEQKHIKIPQIGRVVIEDDVEIGANVCIDRATINETRISKGTKIDNLVHIAHNVFVGENVLLLAQVGIAGSSKIGKNTILAGQTGVVDHIQVGENVVAGPRTGIVQNVESNQVVWGTPPIPFNEQKKVALASRKLPKLINEFLELKKRLTRIEEEIFKLTKK